MKRLYFLLLAPAVLASAALSAQPASMEIRFSGRLNLAWQVLDSIKVMNLTHPGDTLLYNPDTTLLLTYFTEAGKPVLQKDKGFLLGRNYPNPFSDRTDFSLVMYCGGQACISVYDMYGREVASLSENLGAGTHTFSFLPGREKAYLLRLSAFGHQQTVKLLCSGSGNWSSPRLEQKQQPGAGGMQPKISNLLSGFWFFPGDELMCIGYSGGLQSGFTVTPSASADYIFEFASNIACPGLDSVLCEGEYYQTVQIFGQCWLNRNLNAGVKINLGSNPANNGTIEKYCIGNSVSSCNTYGGLYTWDEMMQYSVQPGARGICPEGWHVPTDGDWQVLAGAADSYYKIGHPTWNLFGNYGMDVGYNLKSATGWYSTGNGCDLLGFNCRSGGYLYNMSNWAGGDLFTIFYTSTLEDTPSGYQPWTYGFSWIWDELGREYKEMNHAMPVRCIKNTE